MMKVLTAATRGGGLAIAQTRIVVSALKQIYPDIEIKIKRITTAGDLDRHTTLWKLRQTGFFTSQLEDALLRGQADLAVHSFKDLPTDQHRGLTIAAVYRQRFAEDCLIAAAPVDSIEQLPAKAKIGTSSLRRAVQLKRLRANIRVLPVRGNVETRLRLLEEKKIDALVLAGAGLKRLGLEDKISVCFDPRQFIPAPAQGVLVVQTRTDDKVVRNLTAAVDDEQMRTITFAERQVLITTQCGCHAPVGAFAKIAGNDIIIDAFISDAEGENFIRRRTSGPAAKAQKLAEKTAQELLDAGGKKILASLKK